MSILQIRSRNNPSLGVYVYATMLPASEQMEIFKNDWMRRERKFEQVYDLYSAGDVAFTVDFQNPSKLYAYEAYIISSIRDIAINLQKRYLNEELNRNPHLRKYFSTRENLRVGASAIKRMKRTRPVGKIAVQWWNIYKVYSPSNPDLGVFIEVQRKSGNNVARNERGTFLYLNTTYLIHREYPEVVEYQPWFPIIAAGDARVVKLQEFDTVERNHALLTKRVIERWVNELSRDGSTVFSREIA
jgi:hypothetical protein